MKTSIKNHPVHLGSKPRIVQFRITEPLAKDLHKYCKKNKVRTSTAIRYAIARLVRKEA